MACILRLLWVLLVLLYIYERDKQTWNWKQCLACEALWSHKFAFPLNLAFEANNKKNISISAKLGNPCWLDVNISRCPRHTSVSEAIHKLQNEPFLCQIAQKSKSLSQNEKRILISTSLIYTSPMQICSPSSDKIHAAVEFESRMGQVRLNVVFHAI